MPCWSIFYTSLTLATSAPCKVVKWVYATCGCQSITTQKKVGVLTSVGAMDIPRVALKVVCIPLIGSIVVSWSWRNLQTDLVVSAATRTTRPIFLGPKALQEAMKLGFITKWSVLILWWWWLKATEGCDNYFNIIFVSSDLAWNSEQTAFLVPRVQSLQLLDNCTCAIVRVHFLSLIMSYPE